MHSAYYSSVLPHPVDYVWGVVRDFNSYPRWVDGAAESFIENDKRGDKVGAVRRFCYDGAWVRQWLTSHSDTERSFGYVGMEPFPFPAQDSLDAPGAVEYAGCYSLGSAPHPPVQCRLRTQKGELECQQQTKP